METADERRAVTRVMIDTGMLWVDADDAIYDADTTQLLYAQDLARALYQAGYENARVMYSTRFEVRTNEGMCFDYRYDEIRALVDNTPAEYIERAD